MLKLLEEQQHRQEKENRQQPKWMSLLKSTSGSTCPAARTRTTRTKKELSMSSIQLLWEHRDEFPRHFCVFKQCAAHLHHEANVEQIFSLAGRISDPSLDPEHLQRMVQVNFNRKFHMPTIEKIRAKYFVKYRKAGSVNKNKDACEDVQVGEE
ncbi:hypothetical protein AB1Y20_005298 [Prymnesium parvum]|uniref:HAT C-terminal dimerisation domain-containing protein n=1 Tax=Prymnesium parvum TaxID=97485 RepID=A0AB34J301_PRYPA